MSPSTESSKRSVTLRVAKLPLLYWKQFFLAMVALAGGAAANLAIPEYVRRVLNSKSIDIIVSTLPKVVTPLVVIIIFQSVCYYFRALFFGIVGQQVVADIRKKLFKSIVNQGIAFFDQNRVGDLASRLNADAGLLQNTVSINLSVVIRYSLQALFGIAMMVLISWELTLSLAGCLIIQMGISTALAKKLKRYSKIAQVELGKANIVAEETIGAIRTVKAFVNERFAIYRYSRSVQDVYQAGISRTNISAILQSLASLLMNISMVLILWLGVIFAQHGRISSGDLTGFMMYGVIVAVSFAFLIGAYSEFIQGVGAAERIFEIIDSTPIEKKVVCKLPVSELVREVRLHGVSFSYPSRPDMTVLRDISFEIKAGQTVALVGPSGAGKSSIVQLILGFYSPTAGKIFFGEHEISTIDPYQLRSSMALVSQEPQVFAVTIAENLRIGKEDASSEQIMEACRKARILEFIESLPDRYDTFVGDRGVQLSVGQKQRLAIARAILRNPNFLILDEATSSLDSENEFLVQQALNELMSGRSSLVIAHRLSTVKNADLVLVMDKGRIIQRGTHRTLSAEEGLYRQLVERQELTQPAVREGLSPSVM